MCTINATLRVAINWFDLCFPNIDGVVKFVMRVNQTRQTVKRLVVQEKGGELTTAETCIKEPTFLDDSLLKALTFCLYNPYIMEGGSVSLKKTLKKCIPITVAFSPIIYFTY